MKNFVVLDLLKFCYFLFLSFLISNFLIVNLFCEIKVENKINSAIKIGLLLIYLYLHLAKSFQLIVQT